MHIVGNTCKNLVTIFLGFIQILLYFYPPVFIHSLRCRLLFVEVENVQRQIYIEATLSFEKPRTAHLTGTPKF